MDLQKSDQILDVILIGSGVMSANLGALLKSINSSLKIELYDLAADLSETEDLASKHPDIVEKIREMMMDQHVPSKEFPIAVID